MRVAACTSDGNLRIERRPVPSPGPGEVVLRLAWCGFCGTDLFKLDNQTQTSGTVLGHELVGIVQETGDGVTALEVGDRVVVPHHVACGQCGLCRRGSRTLCSVFKENLMSPGGFSEFVLLGKRVVSEAARIIPDHVSDESAAFLEPAACVLRGIDKAEIRDPKGCAVVIGGGSMGLLHLVVLRAVHPELSVIVTDPIEERRVLAERLGATSSCPPDQLETTAKAVTGNLGADAVFDTVGGSGILVSAMVVLRAGGTVVLFAHALEGETAGFEINPFFKNERRVVATYSGSLDEQDRVANLIFSGRLDPRPLVTHRIPLDRAQDAVDLARSRQALKILIGPPSNGAA